MKRVLITIIAALMLLAPAASTAESAPIIIATESTPTPMPIPTPEPNPVSYFTWTQDDIDTMAQGYWVWCNTEAEKFDFTMLVINRMMSKLQRSDGSDLFPKTVEDVMTQSGEFQISEAHISDNNRVLAVRNLNQCMTQWTVGNAGVIVPKSALYAGRIDGVLTMYDNSGNVVWRCS